MASGDSNACAILLRSLSLNRALTVNAWSDIGFVCSTTNTPWSLSSSTSAPDGRTPASHLPETTPLYTASQLRDGTSRGAFAAVSNCDVTSTAPKFGGG